jgi:hypothetical protein
MHVLGLPSRFARRRSRKRLSFALRDQSSCHAMRERCLWLLMAILAILLSSPRTAYADAISRPSQARIAVNMETASAQQMSRPVNVIKSRPLIPLGGLPMLPAVLLWFPETENMSDVQVVGVQSEPSPPHSRSYRWLRIGMLILFGLGLLGMLFG